MVHKPPNLELVDEVILSEVNEQATTFPFPLYLQALSLIPKSTHRVS